mgnify:FL=1
MRNLHGGRRMSRGRGFSPLAPIGGVVALAGVLVVAVVAIATLGVALLLPGMRRRVRVFRMGGTPNDGTPPPPASDTARDSARERDKSYAEVVELWPFALALALLAPSQAHARLLVPMDDAQANHLKAYGLTFSVLERGGSCEWLLNYRGGSFLLPEDAATVREANIRGVTATPISGAEESRIRAQIADENMESVKLEKAPRIAVYIPPNAPPWDDAVTLALTYADIPYQKVWDEEVLKGDLKDYDWLHLHHEDFTGQHGKFWASYHQIGRAHV